MAIKQQPKNEPAQDRASNVEALRLQHEELRLTREITAMEISETDRRFIAAAQESLRVDNFVNPWEWLTDNNGSPYQGYYGLTETRDEGRNRPFIETEQDLIEMRGFARVMVNTNPYLKGVLENLTNYVIGTGFVYTATAKKSAIVPQELVDLVQDCIDEFNEENLWSGNAEREIFQRGVRDGEAPIRLHHVGGGRCKMRIIEPEYIKQPYGEVRALEEYLSQQYPDMMDWYAEPSSWTFGVHTPERDIEDHLGYFAEWSPGGNDWEYIPADDVIFIRSNVDRNIKRGLSDFYPVQGLSDRAMKLCRNIATGATVQSAIAFIEEMEEGVSAAQGKEMAELVAEYQRRMSNGNGTIRTDNFSTLGEGTKLTIPKGRAYKPGPMGQSSAPVYIDVLQGVLRAIGTRWSMPEYMVSGDASNGSYASTFEAGTPFVKACEASQFFYRGYFRATHWKVLRHAYNAGKFDRFVTSFQQLKRLIHLDVSAPDIEVRDPKAETDRRAALFAAGGLSLQTWMAEEGYDLEQETENENKRIAEQKASSTPPPIGPGVNIPASPASPAAPPAQDTATPMPQAAPAVAPPAQESVAAESQADAITKIFDAIWDY